MQQEHLAGVTPKAVVLSFVGSFPLKALHKKKETLKGMCLCQMYLCSLLLGLLFLILSHAEAQVNFPLSVSFYIGWSATPS